MTPGQDPRFVAAGRYYLHLAVLGIVRVDENPETHEQSLRVTFTTCKSARIRGPEVGPLRSFFIANAHVIPVEPEAGRADSGPPDADPASQGAINTGLVVGDQAGDNK